MIGENTMEKHVNKYMLLEKSNIFKLLKQLFFNNLIRLVYTKNTKYTNKTLKKLF